MYKFKSKVSGDVIMTGPVGDRVLRAMGREPAPQGILEVAALPGLLTTLERAIGNDQVGGATDARADHDRDSSDSAEPISLKQRAWPLVEMMRRSEAMHVEIVWGI